ncbi:DUF5305 domain-containing protein [Halorhabdus amylolytica]|uniref:DUF5305 domain-containing protein n=1 Tax=Halorhabdus amylolytica TaxID=2559573 RepID=UPI0010AAC6CA|nr:DUF5305 domain-containing protein [Halorhabdus amylolytica]
MSRWDLRVRARVVDNYELLLAVAVLLGLLGGFLTYTTHVDPGTSAETREVSSWESSGEFTHRATVMNGTAAFAEGSTLRNRSVYFREITPRLNGSFAYAYRASDGGDLTVETTVSLVFRSIEQAQEEQDDATVFWRDSRVLTRERNEGVSPGDRVTSSFSTNVSAAANEVSRIDEQHGGTPGQLEVAIVAETAITGTRNGEPVDVTRTYRLPIDPGDSVYRVQDPGVVTKSGDQTTQVTVPATHGSLRRMGGPVLLVLSLAAVAGLAYGRWTDRLTVTARERDWLAYRSDRDAYDEWITTGRVDDEDADEVIRVDSLEGLVDVAIDTNGRVIEDERRHTFVVLDDDRRYHFERPPEPNQRRGEPLESEDGDE